MFSIYGSIKTILEGKRILLVALSFTMPLLIAINTSIVHSPIVGCIASVLYLLIDGTLLGQVFFGKLSFFFKILLGIFLLIMVLGFVSWIVMITYNLDILRSILVLFVLSAFSCVVNASKTALMKKAATSGTVTY